MSPMVWRFGGGGGDMHSIGMHGICYRKTWREIDEKF